MNTWKKTVALALALVMMAAMAAVPAAAAEQEKMFNIVLTAAFTGLTRCAPTTPRPPM